jgi:hypothetical protein
MFYSFEKGRSTSLLNCQPNAHPCVPLLRDLSEDRGRAMCFDTSPLQVLLK